jgi:hypothetical protein
MSEEYGPCSSCGRQVRGKMVFIGPIQFHCDTPPCWPLRLTIYDGLIKDQLKDLLKGESDE